MEEPDIQNAILIKHGKVKDFYLFKGMEPTQEAFGVGYQTWPDDFYSLFDYGRFPQKIPGKAEAMYKETVNFFKILDKEKIKHHMIEDMGNRKIKVLVARIPSDYDWIEPGKTATYLIPVEVVFSQWITPVASLHGRLRKGTEDPKKYGLERPPERDETVMLKSPKITLSTKIEATDKYEAEIKKDLLTIAGMDTDEKTELNVLTLDVYDAIKRNAEDTGLIIADGKLEFIMSPQRNLYVADSCNTWDENRILYQLSSGRFVDLSKQFVRNIYAINGYKSELKKAQSKFLEDKSKWSVPPMLSDEQMELVMETNDAVKMGLLKEKGADRKLKHVSIKVHNELEKLKEKYNRDELGNPL